MFRTSAVLTASAIIAMSYGTAMADFTAYNDLGGTSSGNVTNIHYGVTNPAAGDAPSGLLKNYATGNNTSVTLTLSTPGGYSVAGQDIGDARGTLANAGTDAYSIFGGKIDGKGYLWFNDQVGAGTSRTRLTFSGLSANAQYEVAIFGNRAGNYTDRYTITEIGSADAYANTSSVGATIAGAQTTVMTGNNTANGYVAKYSNILAGNDGSFYVDIYGLGNSGNTYKWYANAVSLSETVVPEPASLSLIGLAGLAMLKRRRSL